MRSYATLGALGLALLVAPPVVAQDASPGDTQLQIERRQRRVIVRPGTSLDAIEQDAEAAQAVVEQRRHQQETVRELTRPVPRRPDLDYDVKSGIQSQRLNDALRPR